MESRARLSTPLPRGHLFKPFHQHVQVPRPSFLVPTPHLIVGHVGVMERDLRAAVPRRERDRHDRFQPARRFRNPRVLDSAAAIEADEAAVMRPRSALVLDDVVEEAVDEGIDNGALNAVPEPARTLRVESPVEHLVGRATDCAGHREIKRLHLVHPFCAKKASRRSRRSFQNRS